MCCADTAASHGASPSDPAPSIADCPVLLAKVSWKLVHGKLAGFRWQGGNDAPHVHGLHEKALVRAPEAWGSGASASVARGGDVGWLAVTVLSSPALP